MKGYSDITLKYLKKNKKRTLFTVVGIILSLSLISGIGFLGLSFKDYMYDRAIKFNGDYEFGVYDLNKDAVNILKNDVDLEKVGVNYHVGNFTLENKEDIIIDIYGEDETYFYDIYGSNLEEGNFPENDKEVVLTISTKEYLGFSVGDTIKLEEKQYDSVNSEWIKTGKKTEYKIVGFSKEQYVSQGTYFSGFTGLKALDDNVKYNVVFSVINNKNKNQIAYEKIENLEGYDFDGILNTNNQLLALKGESSYSGINIVIKGIVVFVMGVIIVATIFLIYNAINISVAERMNHFGILRSIGATPKQVANLVFNEAFIMCLIAIPFGVIFGYLGVWVTVKILDIYIADMLGAGSLVIKFYPMVILFTSILGEITIFLASFGPAKKAGKISPISIVKGNVEGEKVKYYSGKIIRRLFGVEGWIAYKNIRKNYKRFMVTILSLSISLIMFITFTTINMKRIDELAYMNKSSLTHGVIYSDKNSEEISEKLEDIDGIEKVYITGWKPMRNLGIDMNLLTEEYKNNTNIMSINSEYLADSNFLGYNDKALKELGIEELKDNEVILINSFAKYNDAGKLENIEITKLKEGDTLKVPVSNFKDLREEEDFEQVKKDKEEGNFIEFKVKKIIDKNPFDSGYNNMFQVIFNNDRFEELFSETYIDSRTKYRYSNIADREVTKRVSEKVKELSDSYGVTFIDSNEENIREEQMWMVINVFVYGFIIIVSLIGIVNVVNTISLNILLKKKEFGTLGTIGMDKNQLSKMIILEGVLHGVISSIIGGILSVGLVLVAVKIVASGFDFSSNLYWQPFVIGFLINIIVTTVAALIPLNKLKRMSLVETVRNIE